jgi:hypothetical protein
LILGHDELVLRAKSFGRPKLDLEVHRGDRVSQFRGLPGSCGSSSNPKSSPPQLANSRSHFLGEPTYAAMAARLPPTGARGPPQRGPPLPRTAGGGPAGRQPLLPRGPTGGGPVGGPSRRGSAVGGQNHGGGNHFERNFNQQRYDSFDRRKEWRPGNRPITPVHPNMNQPGKEPAHAQHASGVNKGECSRQKILSEQDEVMKKAKKPRAPHCFRSKCNGHTAEECTANLDCVVCNKDSHLFRKCPIVKMTKPMLLYSD